MIMHKSMESPAPQYPENVGDFFHFRLFFLSWYAEFQLHLGASIREPGQKAGLRGDSLSTPCWIGMPRKDHWESRPFHGFFNF